MVEFHVKKTTELLVIAVVVTPVPARPGEAVWTQLWGPLHRRASSLWAPKNSVESERRKRERARGERWRRRRENE